MNIKTIIATLLFSVLLAGPAMGKVYLTRDDALQQVFAGAKNVERKNLFLTDENVKQIEALSKTKLDSKLFTYYEATDGKGSIGYAVFGSHVVRTKPEVYMVVVNPDGSLKHVEILAFYEPEEHLPPKRWFEQFTGKLLDENLWPRRGIKAVSGATLSANAITQEVRKVLAVFEVMIIIKN